MRLFYLMFLFPRNDGRQLFEYYMDACVHRRRKKPKRITVFDKQQRVPN